MNSPDKLFYQSQRDWISDDSPLKLIVKSRQTGFSWCNAFRLVRKRPAGPILLRVQASDKLAR